MPRSFLITNKRYKAEILCAKPEQQGDTQQCPEVIVTPPEAETTAPLWPGQVLEERVEESMSCGENEALVPALDVPSSPLQQLQQQQHQQQHHQTQQQEHQQQQQQQTRDPKPKLTYWQDEISRDYEPRDCSAMGDLASSPTRLSETAGESLDYSPEPVDFSTKGRPSPTYDISPTYFPNLFSSVMEEKLSGSKTPAEYNSAYISDEFVYKNNFTHLDYSLNALVEKAWSEINVTDTHVCPECGKRYSTSSNLARHRQTHRSVTDKKARKCPHCEKVYVSMPAFSMHVRTHNQGCECQYCGKRFSRPWLLQGHIRTHTGEKPFTCPQCHKAFADKSNLRAHVQTHSTEKPYVCGRCGKAFALKSYLYKHEESSCMRGQHHQLEQPYPGSRESVVAI